MVEVGHTIEKYRLTRRIGSGGMGEVFIAENTIIGKQVALKLLRPELADDEKSLQRFIQEARTASAVSHPGIAEIYDFGWTQDRCPFIVMELLRGVSLDKVIQHQGKLDIDAAISVTEQILSVLIAVHNKSIVHRDLKPENIFLTRTFDGEEQVKVLDFGVSKVKSGPKVERLTHTGVVLGTAYYMSPEQARGDHDIDSRVDIWALGAMVYEMLTGQLPFPGDSYNQVLARIVTYDFVPLRRHLPEVPEWLERVVYKAMAHDREERYSSAGAFLGDLKAATESADRTSLRSTALLYGIDGEQSSKTAISKLIDAFSSAPTMADFDTGRDTLPKPSEQSGVGARSRISDKVIDGLRQTTRRGTRAIAIVAGAVVILGLSAGLAVAMWKMNTGSEQRAREVVIEGDLRPSKQAVETSHAGDDPEPAASDASASGVGAVSEGDVAHEPSPHLVILDEAAVREGTAEVQTRLRGCLGSSPEQRAVELRLLIERDGQVVLADADRLEPTLRRCIEDALSRASFSSFDGGLRQARLRLEPTRPRRSEARQQAASETPSSVPDEESTDGKRRPTKRNPFDDT